MIFVLSRNGEEYFYDLWKARQINSQFRKQIIIWGLKKTFYHKAYILCNSEESTDISLINKFLN